MIEKIFQEHEEVISLVKEQCLDEIEKAAEVCKAALKGGRTIFFCGNGGSAADCQHIAAELVGRFVKERRGLPAVALTTDTSILTAVGNDYGYQRIFSRQVEALVRKEDVVIGLSTSGNSTNVLLALEKARELGAVTIGMTGGDGGKMSTLCDISIVIPSQITARIQEAHILIGHTLCQFVDEVFEDEKTI